MADVTKVDEGLFVIREHDTPHSVAHTVYGDGHRYPAIIKANREDWEEGEQIKVPNKKGRVTIYDDVSVEVMLKRMFPNQPVHIFMELFMKWNNGGDISEGAIVFVPER